ncbi:FAD-dependent oxidoreductase [Komagataeibacter europaeus]|uniref:FAD-dependent oxidoreductase n=1 Tax=Komagataeibacter europaeus TaxID=33995 RepID=UPI0015FC9A91|nr:FAD-binding protein [Komagataeibacter europaeus]
MSTDQILTIDADILIIGGGLAGCWAALTAARSGMRVVLAEKGYCGTSGVAATAGPGHWWVPPEPGAREEAVAKRLLAAQGLGNAAWMLRIIERTFETLPSIATHYRHEPDGNGNIRPYALRGPEYLRALRQKVLAAGVHILDHAPATHLMRDADGVINGARGVLRQGTDTTWLIRAGATVLATGGCAFGSSLLGAANNTGDGLLMAAEVGAELSGMEFSAFFTIAPARTTMARTMIYSFARYYDSDGRLLVRQTGPHDNAFLALALSQGPVFCDLSAVPEDIRRQLPQISPNVTITFRRLGIDPFKQRFPITLLGEGTVRGIGGIRVTGLDSGCGVPGLFVAGDVASREQVTGPISGGGAVNSAWALASGCIAAESAITFLKTSRGDRVSVQNTRTQENGIRMADAAVQRETERTITAEMLAPEKQYFRSARTLQTAIERLANCHHALNGLYGGKTPRARQRFRELQAMLATARWCSASALARESSLGLHQRIDSSSGNTRPFLVRSSGLDIIRTRCDPVEIPA